MSFFVPRRVSLLDGFGCCDGARDFLLKMSRMFRLFDRVSNSHLHVICDDVTAPQFAAPPHPSLAPNFLLRLHSKTPSP